MKPFFFLLPLLLSINLLFQSSMPNLSTKAIAYNLVYDKQDLEPNPIDEKRQQYRKSKQKKFKKNKRLNKKHFLFNEVQQDKKLKVRTIVFLCLAGFFFLLMAGFLFSAFFVAISLSLVFALFFSGLAAIAFVVLFLILGFLSLGKDRKRNRQVIKASEVDLRKEVEHLAPGGVVAYLELSEDLADARIQKNILENKFKDRSINGTTKRTLKKEIKELDYQIKSLERERNKIRRLPKSSNYTYETTSKATKTKPN